MSRDKLFANAFYALLLCITAVSSAATPPVNSIPVIGQRINQLNVNPIEDVEIRHLADLASRHMDGIHFWDTAENKELLEFLEDCDDTGILLVFAPVNLEQYFKTDWGPGDRRFWFRNPDALFTGNSAFCKCSETLNALVDSVSADSMMYSDTIGIADEVHKCADIFKKYDCLWFYYICDEGTGQQWSKIRNPDSTKPYKIYFPGIFPGTRTGTEPDIDHVASSGMYSWVKFAAEHDDTLEVPTTLNFAAMYTIEPGDYTGITNTLDYGTPELQATCVNAVCTAMYQPPPAGGGIMPPPVSNKPDFILFDFYPFRYVDSESSTTATMCDSDWEFAIDLLETELDSTIVTALSNGVDVYYLPQAFGMAGGPKMLNSSGGVHYRSWAWRKPSPEEFLLSCNLALMHQAKAIMPYSIRSYVEIPNNLSEQNNFISSSLLDINLIPFDADYEEYVYTSRYPEGSQYSYEYIRPDLIPPWKPGYDPLYTLPAAPSNTADAKYQEAYSEWLYKPHSDLYRRLRYNLAQIVKIAPALCSLYWCDGYENNARIELDKTEPSNWVEPRIRVFEDSESEQCFLFYVNAYCREEETPFEITLKEDSLPLWANCTDRLLDHSRRFIMEGTESSSGTFTFLDTLGPGEARLVELVSTSEPMPADVRITDNNVWAIHPERGDSVTSDMRAVPGESVHVVARFWNMGTGGRRPIRVGLYDTSVSPEREIGTSTIGFSGLSHSSGHCREAEYQDVIFNWDSITTDDIGAHVLEARALTWSGEPNGTDNTATAVFLVEPCDWATEVRHDPWDMTESDTPSSPWYTDDIESMFGWSTSSFTDSISGMFEGAPEFGFYQSNRMTLAMDGNTVNGNDYFCISLIGKSDYNPCDVYLNWTNDASVSDSQLIGTLDLEWGVLEPFDLSNNSNWYGHKITDIHLSFRRSGNLPYSVRLGWIKLENGEL